MQKTIGAAAKGPKPGLSRMMLYFIGLMPWTYDLQHMCMALVKLRNGNKAAARADIEHAIAVIFANTELETADVVRLMKKGLNNE